MGPNWNPNIEDDTEKERERERISQLLSYDIDERQSSEEEKRRKKNFYELILCLEMCPNVMIFGRFHSMKSISYFNQIIHIHAIA